MCTKALNVSADQALNNTLPPPILGVIVSADATWTCRQSVEEEAVLLRQRYDISRHMWAPKDMALL